MDEPNSCISTVYACHSDLVKHLNMRSTPLFLSTNDLILLSEKKSMIAMKTENALPNGEPLG